MWLRHVARLAREAGAKGFIVIGEPKGETSDALAASAGIVSVRLHTMKAKTLFASEGKDLGELEKTLAALNPHENSSFVLSQPLTLQVSLQKEKMEGQNIIAMLPAIKPTDKCIILGAHYDHLGLGETGSLLANST